MITFKSFCCHLGLVQMKKRQLPNVISTFVNFFERYVNFAVWPLTVLPDWFSFDIWVFFFQCNASMVKIFWHPFNSRCKKNLECEKWFINDFQYRYIGDTSFPVPFFIYFIVARYSIHMSLCLKFLTIKIKDVFFSIQDGIFSQQCSIKYVSRSRSIFFDKNVIEANVYLKKKIVEK